MKRLMYLSISVFFLSLTLLVGVHIGQQTAGAAPSQKVIGFSYDDRGTIKGYSVMLANGDVYFRRSIGTFVLQYQPELVGNYWQ